MHKPGGETNTGLNTFPLMTTRGNPANNGLRQASSDNSDSAKLCPSALLSFSLTSASPIDARLR